MRFTKRHDFSKSSAPKIFSTIPTNLGTTLATLCIAHGGGGEVIICNDDDFGWRWIVIIRRLRAREISYIVSSRSSGHW